MATGPTPPTRPDPTLDSLVARTTGMQWWRRVFHMGCGFVAAAAAAFLPLTRVEILVGLGVIFAGSLAVDLVRLSKPGANRLFYRLFPSLLTPRDAGRLASSTWYVLGVLVVFLLFDHTIAIAATLVLAVADPVGNVVGRTVGKRPFGTGTVEGTLGLVAASFLAIVALVGPLHAAAASLATGWAETRRVPVDDNLTVPLAAGFVLWLMTLLP